MSESPDPIAAGSRPGGPPARTDGGAGPWLWFAGFLAFALATHTYVLEDAMTSDNCLFVRYAREWAAGAKPYVVWYDSKPPVVFWIFRAIDFGDPRVDVYVAGAVLAAAAAAELRRALLAVSQPVAGSFAGLFYVAWTGMFGYQHLYDAFALPTAVLATAWLGLAAARGSRAYTAAAGVAYGVLVGCFPPAAVYLIAWLPFLFLGARKHGPRFARTGLLLFFVGVAGVWVPVVAHAVRGGYWDGFVGALAANRRYGALDRVPLATHFDRWCAEWYRLVTAGGAFPAFAVCGSLAGLVGGWRRVSREVRVWAVVAGLWLVAAQAGTFPGGRHFGPYYSFLLGPLAVLGSLGWAAVPPALSVRGFCRVLIGAFVAATLTTHWIARYSVYRAYDMKTTDSFRTPIWHMTYFIDAMIPADEPVLVCVWGRDTEIYWQAPRPAPSPHIIPWNLVEIRPELFAAWADDVLRNPPQWIITDNVLLGPGATDDFLRVLAPQWGGATLTDTPSYIRLRQFVRDRYDLVNGTGDMLILRRKPLPAG